MRGFFQAIFAVAIHIASGNLGFSRKAFVETKEVLMKRSEELAEKGKEGLYEEYVKPYRHV